MARNGNGLKAVETREPNDLYDQLSQDMKDHWDAIGTLGFTKIEKGFGGMWFASKAGQDKKNAIGPAESISALHGMVQEWIADQPIVKEEEVDADAQGNTFLPGAKEVVRTVDIPELRQPSLDFHVYLNEAKEAKDKVKSQRDLLTKLIQKHRSILPVDPSTGDPFFRVVDPENPTAKTVRINLKSKGEQIECIEEGGDEE